MRARVAADWLEIFEKLRRGTRLRWEVALKSLSFLLHTTLGFRSEYKQDVGRATPQPQGRKQKTRRSPPGQHLCWRRSSRCAGFKSWSYWDTENAGRWRWSNQTHKRWKCPPKRNANTKPDRRHDRTSSNSPRRNHRRWDNKCGPHGWRAVEAGRSIYCRRTTPTSNYRRVRAGEERGPAILR